MQIVEKNLRFLKNKSQTINNENPSINNGVKAPFKNVDLGGNTEQKSYQGYNLFNYEDLTNQQYITINGSEITINNTTEQTIYPAIEFFRQGNELEAGTYTLKTVPKSCTGTSQISIFVQDDINDYSPSTQIVQQFRYDTTATAITTKTFTNTIKRILFAVPAGMSITLSMSILVKGSYTASNFPTYEPYVRKNSKSKSRLSTRSRSSKWRCRCKSTK